MRFRTLTATGSVIAVSLVGIAVAPTAATAAPTGSCHKLAATELRLCMTVTARPVQEIAALLRAEAPNRLAAPPKSGTTRAARATTAAAGVGWEADPNPAALPQFCDAGPTRVTDCTAAEVAGAVVDTQGKVKGTATLGVIYWAALSNKALTWNMGAKAVVTSATGSALTGSTVNGTAVCSGRCTVTGNSTAKLPLVIGAQMRGAWKITSATPGAAPVTSTQQIKITLQSPAPNLPGSGTTPSLSTVRCDNSATLGNIGKGCVYRAVTPVFLLDGTAAPASPVHAAFVSSAQARLAEHPGRTDGTPLTRLADPVRRDANRAASCRGFVPNNSTDSCDEYPFASTYQGGAGAATAHVPRTDNSAGGSKLSGFYQSNRVLDKDSFFVQVVN